MYGLKIAGMDQVSFGPVPVLMVVKIIWSTDNSIQTLGFFTFFCLVGTPKEN